MPILSGQVVTADDLNHLKPTTYAASASGTVSGVVTNADVTGATITFDTETDNAVYVAHIDADLRYDGATTGNTAANAGIAVDGVNSTPRAIMGTGAAGVAGDRATASQTYRGTLATAGSHTIKMITTLSDADMDINATHTTLTVTIYEVV